jgi:hypothetical protein
LGTSLRQVLDRAVAKNFPEAAQTHPRSPLRRGKGDIDYESQAALLIVHKGSGQKTNAKEVAQTLVEEIQKDLPEFLDSVVLSTNNVLHFRLRCVSLESFKHSGRVFLFNGGKGKEGRQFPPLVPDLSEGHR